MDDKAYIVMGSSGHWEDYREWCDKVFLDENKAQEYRNNLNVDLDKRKKENELLRLSYEEKECTKETCEGCKGYNDGYDYSLDEQHEYEIQTVDLQK